MARRAVGINQNVQQRLISGARVAFDPRTTSEICDTIDGNNRKASEKYLRTQLWEQREREKQREAAE